MEKRPIQIGFKRGWLVHESGSNVVALCDIEDKDPAIADFARPGCFGENLYDVIYLIVLGNNFDHDFGEQREVIFDSSIDSRMSSLTSVASDFGDRHARNNGRKLVDDITELLLPDDAFDQFHGI